MPESAGYVERRREWLALADEIGKPHGITGRQLVSVLFHVPQNTPTRIDPNWRDLFDYVESNNFAADVIGGTDD